MTDWTYDDPSIDNDELLYRKVLDRPEMCTWDYAHRTWTVHPGAFRRLVGNDPSTHRHKILEERGRDILTLYPSPYGSLRFPVAVPRRHHAGVVSVDDPDEADADLRAAHAEVRPEKPQKDKLHWKTVANEIAQASVWVVLPATREKSN